jgi:glutaconate CoA-transferase subunit B
MICAAASELRGGDVVFVGIGLPSIACNLARATHAPDAVLIYESGTIDTRPGRLPLSIGDPALVTGAAMVAPMAEVFQFVLQRGRIDIGFLGAAQIDRTGSASEIAAHARRVVVMAVLDPMTFPARVDFVTSPGSRVAKVITDRCVLERDSTRNELVLSALFSGVSVDDVRSMVRWDLQVARTVATTPPPDAATRFDNCGHSPRDQRPRCRRRHTTPCRPERFALPDPSWRCCASRPMRLPSAETRSCRR